MHSCESGGPGIQRHPAAAAQNHSAAVQSLHGALELRSVIPARFPVAGVERWNNLFSHITKHHEPQIQAIIPLTPPTEGILLWDSVEQPDIQPQSWWELAARSSHHPGPVKGAHSVNSR
ncbi:unnamed protein product [Lepidochelys kempii]